MNGNTAYVLIDHFAFASMEPCPDLDPKGPDLVSNGAGAAHTARRAVEGSKDAIAGRFDLMAAKAREVTTDDSVMIIEKSRQLWSPSAAAFSVEPTMS